MSVTFGLERLKFKSSVDWEERHLLSSKSCLVETLKLLALGFDSDIMLPAGRRDFPIAGGVALVAKVTRVSCELTMGRGRVGTSLRRSTWDWLVVGVSSVT